MTCWRALTRRRCYSEFRPNALEPKVFNLLLKVAVIGGVIARRRHTEVWNAVRFADGVIYWLVLGPELSVCSCRAELFTTHWR